MRADFTALFPVLTFCAFHILVVAHNFSDQDPETLLVRYFEGDGYHRLLKFSAVIRGNDVIEFQNSCGLMIHQVLPRSLYVDPEQLNQLSNFSQVLNEYFVGGDIDIEGSEETSTSTSVFISCNTENAISQKTPCATSSFSGDVVQYSFLLPVHVRYHAPRSTGGYRYIEIPPPFLFIKCSSVGDEFLSQMLTMSQIQEILLPTLFEGWKSVAFKENFDGDKQEDLVLMVPVGDLDHLASVQSITLVLVNLAALYLLSSLFSSISF